MLIAATDFWLVKTAAPNDGNVFVFNLKWLILTRILRHILNKATILVSYCIFWCCKSLFWLKKATCLNGNKSHITCHDDYVVLYFFHYFFCFLFANTLVHYCHFVEHAYEVAKAQMHDFFFFFLPLFIFFLNSSSSFWPPFVIHKVFASCQTKVNIIREQGLWVLSSNFNSRVVSQYKSQDQANSDKKCEK